MDNKIKSILKTLSLIFLWLIFPPVFLFFSIKWNTPKLFSRIILTTIAPLSLFILLLISWQGYDYYYYQIKRGSRSEIETKTGLSFPKYKTVEKRHFTYGVSFTGDFTMKHTVQLDTSQIDDFYQQIKNQIKLNQSQNNDSTIVWWDNNRDGTYSFSHNDFQEILELSIDSKTGEMNITYGSL